MKQPTTITLTLKTETPLHVGGDDPAILHLFAKDENKADQVTSAGILKDAKGNPWISGATLKGALGALADGDRDALFGKAEKGETNADETEEETKITAGALWVGPLVMNGNDTPVLDDTPHVRIDRRTGAAEDKKLYADKWVPAGVKFTTTLTLWANDEDTQSKVKNLIFSLREHGLRIGRKTGQGMGHLSLVTVEGIKERASNTKRGDTPLHTLILHCEGPYITLDQTAHKDDAQGQAEEKKNTLKPLIADGYPALPPSSFKGALRQAFHWHLSLDATCNGDDDRDRILSAASEASNLSPIERLFGITGFRGLLQFEITPLKDEHHAKPVELAGVTIDRFTQGTVDGNLYKVEAHCNVGFEVRLRLDERRAADGDTAALEAGLKAIAQDGLRLGHGTTTGFGWFNAKVHSDTGDKQ
ncbi:RAMP superfamily CRISPR-associated protein [Yunchengibacter salinarum]|uniref:RAMP superfamily CRISPR-associated protein n=1 Tax=Yunchengibacter salinarum TaxID=3133399 RepID=UPI0035B638FC